jgi:hypothetical protein
MTTSTHRPLTAPAKPRRVRITTAPAPAPVTRDAGSDTVIHVVLDRSGSMEAIRDATIAGFNAYLDEQAAIPGARFSLTQFSSDAVDHVYTDIPVASAPRLSRHTYQPSGNTPLFDAVGSGIAALEAKRPSGKVVFVIVTDGDNNASHEYTAEAVMAQIERLQSAGWEFVFMGANIDAYAAAASMGILRSSSYAYAATPAGAARAFTDVSRTTTMYRSGAIAAMDMGQADQDAAENAPKRVGTARTARKTTA